jgi:rfaE bifunctional protein nucleotidyltransferase chain/domain
MYPVIDKLFPLQDLFGRREALLRSGKALALTNGCFDVLHAGHVATLEAAKSRCDVLWVGLNSDRSIGVLKGQSRPIHSECDRAYVLGALGCVDGIFLFDGPHLAAEIVQICPDVYVKSSDYTLATLDPSERKALLDCGAAIFFTPTIPGLSTTAVVKKWSSENSKVHEIAN